MGRRVYDRATFHRQLGSSWKWPVHIDQKKKQFSVAYLHAVAAAAGYATYRPSVDEDSIDWGLAAKDGGAVRSPRLELQLKCTERDDFDGVDLRFPLKVKNFNDLIPENVLVDCTHG
jgi:hypothetical protein